METLYNDDEDSLQGGGATAANVPPPHNDGGSFDDDLEDVEFDEDDDDFRLVFSPEDFAHVTEMWDQGLHEEAYQFVSQRVEPDQAERFREILELTSGHVEAAEHGGDDDDVLERINEAVADGRFFAQLAPARLDQSYSYYRGGFHGVPVDAALSGELQNGAHATDETMSGSRDIYSEIFHLVREGVHPDEMEQLRHEAEMEYGELDAAITFTSATRFYQEISARRQRGVVPVTAAAAAIAGVEKQRYDAATDADDVGCVICIVDYEDGDELGVMPCASRHRFHDKCLAEWLARSLSCPLCRHPLLPMELHA
ncbi:hypothetical protein HU200_054421 [Digitaria exilis]|uniref:RING-type domain-containing protein n=1 Tax=Digitaria exilis TaxID=1010633 RepID=A0A835E443_9POAL|nr:hypothetical protein HU200_054421 [Digitaria exilis]CAB3490914.1 unnamed protein product [Digitaria exilis]